MNNFNLPSGEELLDIKAKLFDVTIALAELKSREDITAFIKDNNQVLEQLHTATATFGTIYKQKLKKSGKSVNGFVLPTGAALDALESTIFNLSQALPYAAEYVDANREGLDNFYIIAKDFVELYNSLYPDVENEIS